MSDVFRETLAGNSESTAAARRRQVLRIERVALTQAALKHQSGRVFLHKRLEDERFAAPWQPGDTLESVAFRAGRVAILREILAELDETTTPTTPGA